jgi:hypothetical protein
MWKWLEVQMLWPDASFLQQVLSRQNITTLYEHTFIALLVCLCYCHACQIRGLKTKSDHKPVDELAYNSYKSKFMKPSVNEGFSEIISINFVPHFSCEHDRDLYGMFLYG